MNHLPPVLWSFCRFNFFSRLVRNFHMSVRDVSTDFLPLLMFYVLPKFDAKYFVCHA